MKRLPLLGSVWALVLLCAVVSAAQAAARLQPDAAVEVQILAINDFHGALEPPAGGRIAGMTAGGIEYLASHIRSLKAASPHTVVVSAGDNIGGTPLMSSLSHDEAAIEALNMAGLELSTVGNHELDDGWWELYRMQNGGCHPVDGCQDGTPFEGARFKYLSANITLNPGAADPEMLRRAGITGTQFRPLFPPVDVREFDGARVAFIGITLGDATTIVIPSSTRGLIVSAPVDALNAAAAAARRDGADAVVALFHEGGIVRSTDPNGCGDLSEDIAGLVRRMSDDVDVVVTGHSHTAYNCTIGSKLVTSAASAGRVITDIDLRFDRSSGRLLSKTARNVVVSRDAAKTGEATALIAHYAPIAKRIGERVVGAIAETLTRDENEAGESPLGDVVADALLTVSKSVPGAAAEIGFMQAGGIRTDIPRSAALTYARLFEVLPFGNIVTVKTVTGDTILRALEQQFSTEYHDRILQVSAGFSYAYDPTRPLGQRIVQGSVSINGRPLVPSQRYRLVTNEFVWGGGDGFTALRAGTDPVTIGVDIDVLASYVAAHSPVQPGPQNRIRATAARTPPR